MAEFTYAELELLIEMAKVVHNQDDVDRYTKQLKELKKKEAKRGRRK